MTNVLLDSPPGPRPDTRDRPAAPRSGLWLPLACCWILLFNNLSLPGRDGPLSADSLDAIALAKLAARGLTIAAMGLILVREWRTRRCRSAAWCLFPLGLFVAWAIVSTAWSPLRAVSLGQAGGLLALVMTALGIGVRWRGEEDTSLVLLHLSLGLLVVAIILLAADVVFPGPPGLSGMDRAAVVEG
ncbi:MAG: hypothetical protein ABR915_13765, partial [Thermoguttaceae bacterium]